MILDSGDIEPKWESARPPSDDELIEKFRWLAAESVSPERATELVNFVWSLADASDAGKLVTLQAVRCDA